MKRFVAGADRGQSTLLPERLDDWMDESNPVRVIDAFVPLAALMAIYLRTIRVKSEPPLIGNVHYRQHPLNELTTDGELRKLSRKIVFLLSRISPVIRRCAGAAGIGDVNPLVPAKSG